MKLSRAAQQPIACGPEIATITGHSMKDVGAILDEHYLSRDSELAESAIKKLERFENRDKTPK